MPVSLAAALSAGLPDMLGPAGLMYRSGRKRRGFGLGGNRMNDFRRSIGRIAMETRGKKTVVRCILVSRLLSSARIPGRARARRSFGRSAILPIWLNRRECGGAKWRAGEEVGVRIHFG